MMFLVIFDAMRTFAASDEVQKTLDIKVLHVLLREVFKNVYLYFDIYIRKSVYKVIVGKVGLIIMIRYLKLHYLLKFEVLVKDR